MIGSALRDSDESKRERLEKEIVELQSQIDWMFADLEDAKEQLREVQEEIFNLDN